MATRSKGDVRGQHRRRQARLLARKQGLYHEVVAPQVKKSGMSKTRRKHLRHNFNLSPEEYERMFRAQNGLCMICGEPPSGAYLVLAVDHNHATNTVRDLLCSGCNKGLGFFKENIASLYSAIDYLERHGKTEQ